MNEEELLICDYCGEPIDINQEEWEHEMVYHRWCASTNSEARDIDE